MSIVAIILGALIGLLQGMTGAGGGILAVPALMLSMGWSLQQAAPVALLAVSCSAAVGALEGFARGLVRYRAAMLMALIGIPFTSVGLWLARIMPHQILQTLFALLMLFTVYRLIRNAAVEMREDHVLCPINPESGRLVWKTSTWFAIGGLGAVTGLASGLLGVGGGFIIVPALRRLSNLSMHAIVATSLFVIALVGSGGIASAWAAGHEIPFLTALPFMGATVLGMLLGRRFMHFVSTSFLQKGLALLILLVAIGMLVTAWWSF